MNNRDPEFNLEDENEAKLMEERSLEPQPDISVDALPTRLYLEKTTIPHINEALRILAKERPVNPIEFFSYYLLTHNPYKNGEQQEQPEQQQQIENNSQLSNMQLGSQPDIQ